MTALTPEQQDLVSEITRAHRRAAGGPIEDGYERGRTHALDDVARVLLPLIDPGQAATRRGPRTPGTAT